MKKVYQGIDKLFLINSWRHWNSLPEWPIPHIEYPKSINTPPKDIREKLINRFEKSILAKVPIIKEILLNDNIKQHRINACMLGHFRYELNIDVNSGNKKYNRNPKYCIDCSLTKLKYFYKEAGKNKLRHDLLIDVLNLLDLYVNEKFKNIEISNEIPDISSSIYKNIECGEFYTICAAIFSIYMEFFHSKEYTICHKDEGRDEGIGS